MGFPRHQGSANRTLPLPWPLGDPHIAIREAPVPLDLDRDGQPSSGLPVLGVIA